MTAVEWLTERLINSGLELNSYDYDNFEKANELFKQQIIDSHIEGFYSPPFGKSRNGEAEKYYNETFKSE